MYTIDEDWHVNTFTSGSKYFLRKYELVRKVHNLKTFRTEFTVLDWYCTSNFPLDVFTAVMVMMREGKNEYYKRVENFLESKK